MIQTSSLPTLLTSSVATPAPGGALQEGQEGADFSALLGGEVGRIALHAGASPALVEASPGLPEAAIEPAELPQDGKILPAAALAVSAQPEADADIAQTLSHSADQPVEASPVRIRHPRAIVPRPAPHREGHAQPEETTPACSEQPEASKQVAGPSIATAIALPTFVVPLHTTGQKPTTQSESAAARLEPVKPSPGLPLPALHRATVSRHAPEAQASGTFPAPLPLPLPPEAMPGRGSQALGDGARPAFPDQARAAVVAIEAFGSVPSAGDSQPQLRITPTRPEIRQPGHFTSDMPTLSVESSRPDLQVPTSLSIERQMAMPAPLAPAIHAPARPHDFTALVNRLVAAREAVQPLTMGVNVVHAEFGHVRIKVQHEGDGLAVTLASSDPDFARAVSAAPAPVLPVAAIDPVQLASGQGSARAEPQLGQSQTQAQSQSQSRGGASEQRDPRGGGHDQPAQGRHHAPEHRRRSGIFA
jgi:hypothetical protein